MPLLPSISQSTYHKTNYEKLKLLCNVNLNTSIKIKAISITNKDINNISSIDGTHLKIMIFLF